jgi:3-phenylpropionate/trans-cinnamate dioxygenase ferredoxin reductase subunit
MTGTPDSRCVIVGASHAGAQAAIRLRRLGWEGSITLVGDEPRLPYHRPPLSKDYLKGVKSIDNILLSPEAAYQKADISLLLGERVAGIDRDSKQVDIDGREPQAYDKLVLATGSRPRILPLPGVDLAGVHYLRNVDDVDGIRAGAKEGGRAVVIGGGYIGLEAAASLRKLGMQVVVLEALERVLQRVTCETMSAFFMRVHAEEGVEIRVGAKVNAIVGDESVSGIEMESGEILDADLVVIGIGIVPNIELAAEAGLATANGIEVNQFAQTSDPDIYAVGDCASSIHPRYQRMIRLESVQNANDQAIVAAKSICGQPEPYDAVPWFWSDQYDVKLQIAGLAEGADTMITRGDPASGRSMSLLYMKEDRLQAVDAVNSPRDFVFGKRLIIEEAQLDLEKLADSSTLLSEAVKANE